MRDLTRRSSRAAVGLFGLGVLLWTTGAWATEPCGRVTHAVGNVSLYYEGELTRRKVAENFPVCSGTFIQTNHGRIEIDIPPGATLRLEAGSEATLTMTTAKPPHVEVKLSKGQTELDAWSAESTGLTIVTEFGSVTPQTTTSLTLSRTSESAILDVESGVAEMRSASYATLVSTSQRLVMRHGNPLFAPPVAAASGGGQLRDDFAAWIARRREQRVERDPKESSTAKSLWERYARELSEAGTFAPCEAGRLCFKPRMQGFRPPGEGVELRLRDRTLWVPAETWGWCTSHYGHWTEGGGDWVWIPGEEWLDAPARDATPTGGGKVMTHPLFDALEQGVRDGASPRQSDRPSAVPGR